MIAPDIDPAAVLAREHDARTLGAALVARLLADGRVELAGALEALLARAEDIISPNPPHPHREGDPSP